ncbi:helix-turn-helix transcriptional regulator [Methylobacterium sp. 88A]|uniref:helix-turn-helix domain-containing protein n=1 Tax=Methylobacterium sp. 88A TaxID=1131813 RepID=UPI0004775B25|nr:helix-turn-helix transcriptional regulator [Methylobacterium sp. 88A]
MRQRPLADGRQSAVLGCVLREARVHAGLKQAELADRLGIPQSFVSKWETGHRRLDLIELRIVCGAVGIDIQSLIAAFEREIIKEAYP